MIICKHHIFIDDVRLRDFVNNHDLRFFKHQKYLLNKMLDLNDGFTIKLDTWDANTLRNDYELCHKIKHINVIKPLCYFEFEFDILDYFETGKYSVKQYEDISVVISEYFKPIYHDNNIFKQIIYVLFYIFYKYNISFPNINITNIYTYHVDKSKTIRYNIKERLFIIKTNEIVVLDDFANSFKTDDVNILLSNIYDICKFFGKNFNKSYEDPLDILNDLLFFD
jgi:hypothetical protein